MPELPKGQPEIPAEDGPVKKVKPKNKQVAWQHLTNERSLREEARFVVGVVVIFLLVLAVLGPSFSIDLQTGAVSFAGVGVVIVIFGSLAIAWAVRYFSSRKRVQKGVLRLPDGTAYNYLAGDTLAWYHDQVTAPDILNTRPTLKLLNVRRYRGLSVNLTAVLPHVYLDTRSDYGKMSPFYVDQSQRLNLEGNFPDSFKLYGPKDYEIEVLSVFQPDVMATIVDHAGEYDVEIFRDQLRIISRDRVYGRPEQVKRLEAVAAKIIVEIERRLPIWQARPSTAPPLTIYRFRGMAIGGYYVSLRLAAAVLVFGLPGVAGILYALHWRFTADYTNNVGPDVMMFFSLLWLIPLGWVIYGIRERQRVVTSKKKRRNA